jgi:pyruvate dehydrogenase E1 component alpha subunit
MLATRFITRKGLKGSKRTFATITVELPKYETHRLESFKLPTKTTTTGEELMKYFKDMTIMRRVEVVSDLLYKDKEIRGFCHLYDGQEAITVGMEAGLSKQDHIITAYRDHCTAIGRGDTPYGIIAEMMQKKTGSSKGKGGSMHYYDKANRFYGGNGIVGAQVPVGAGVAFGIKYEGKKEVCVAMFGDGAANQGQIYEASNMAGLWKLPCIFTCENNLYGMGTSAERASHNDKFYTRGDKIPGVLTQANSVFAVREAYKWAKQYCNDGNGPLFFELKTYRYHGHSMSDPGITYRTREEVNEYRKNQDCIVLVRNQILGNNVATEKDLKDIEKEAREEIDKVVEQCRKDEMPAPEALFTDIYHNDKGHYIRNCDFPSSLNKDFE